ncbi:MAG: DUF2299 domain-containing protein [Promethearchaeota archaeon]|nr:MAG: DUF2299 domain-containing protein [Candidatus Lokiarchaeota archaeon]
MTEALESTIKQYVERIGVFRGAINNDSLDFGLKFTYPGEKGKLLVVFKPTEKNGIEIKANTQLSPKHLEIVNSFKEKKQKQLFLILQKLFIEKEIHFNIDFKNKRYQIYEKYLFDDNSLLTINKFKNIAKKLFFVDFNAIRIIHAFCQGKISAEDLEGSGAKPSFYS